MAVEVVEGVNALDPNFFEQNPILLFQLKQVKWILYHFWPHQGNIEDNGFLFMIFTQDAISDCFYWFQVEFLKLVSSGDHLRALKVASSDLGPLATSDPALLKPLKETLLALLRPNEDALGKGLPLHALATSLQVLHNLVEWLNKKLLLLLYCPIIYFFKLL